VRRSRGSQGSDRWIEPQFVSVHFAGGTADNADECCEVAFVLQVVVLRDHSAGAVEKTDVEDGPADGDMKGVAHKRASSKVQASDVCNLAKNRFDFRRSFSTLEGGLVVFASLRSDLYGSVPSVMGPLRR